MTAVRVPVFTGHAEAITVEFEDKMNEDIARKAFKNAEGLTLVDNRENGGYVTQFESTGNDDVYISRLRNDTSKENSITFWCVSDNVRKGAALNTIQIAEKMIEMDII